MEIAKRNIHIFRKQRSRQSIHKMSSAEEKGKNTTGDKEAGAGKEAAVPFVFPADDLALPKGSLILATGATGHIASNVIYEALALGYRVRGTVRSEDKATYLKEKVFPAAAQAGTFETAIVSDLTDVDGCEAAVRGCDGVIHLASVVSFSHDPTEVVPVTVAGAVNLLKAAAAPGSTVKRFVYTSSSTAATLPILDKVFPIDSSTWNDATVARVQALQPPYKEDPITAYQIYAASKAEAERAVWKFVADNNPPFTVNAVLPNMNTGRILGPSGYTASRAPAILDGSFEAGFVTPQWFVDVVDDARVHLAALLDKTVANERLFAFAEPFDWNDFIDAVHRARPGRDGITPRLPPHGKDLSVVDNAKAEALLTKWFDVPGWKSIDQSVVENLEGL
ncbi:hypothetical protein DV737_g1092, partial [Chaetothyriales sp. CBS 132003]